MMKLKYDVGDPVVYRNDEGGVVTFEKGDTVAAIVFGKLITETYDVGLDWNGKEWYTTGFGTKTTVVDPSDPEAVRYFSEHPDEDD